MPRERSECFGYSLLLCFDIFIVGGSLLATGAYLLHCYQLIFIYSLMRIVACRQPPTVLTINFHDNLKLIKHFN